jgi:hypothetical protein
LLAKRIVKTLIGKYMEMLANFYEIPQVKSKADKQQLKHIMSIIDDLHIAAYPDERLRGLKTLGLYSHEITTLTGAKVENIRQWARGAQPTAEHARLLEGACTISTWLLRKHYATEPVVAALRDYREELGGQTIIRDFAQHPELARDLVLSLVVEPALQEQPRAA